MTATDQAFYSVERGAHDQERFFATEHTRGPWSHGHQHGGPPMALMARALERGAAPGAPAMQLTRLTVEFLRPVPIAAPLEVVTEVLVAGRRVHRVAVALVSGDRQLAAGVGVRIRVRELELAPPEALEGEAFPPLAQGRPHEFGFFRHAVGYHTATQLRVLEGVLGSGHVRAWMRPRMPLILGEATSAVERVMICADAGHGLGRALDPSEWSFINPDTSVHLWRVPAGEWVGMDARVFAGAMGVGMGRTRLVDERGEYGAALQGQVIEGS